MSERVLDLVDRLRGKYVVAVNDGAGLLNGKDTFERESVFPVRPIMQEAAKEIERLRETVRDLLVTCEAALEDLNDVPGRQRRPSCRQLEAAIAKEKGLSP